MLNITDFIECLRPQPTLGSCFYCIFSTTLFFHFCQRIVLKWVLEYSCLRRCTWSPALYVFDGQFSWSFVKCVSIGKLFLAHTILLAMKYNNIQYHWLWKMQVCLYWNNINYYLIWYYKGIYRLNAVIFLADHENNLLTVSVVYSIITHLNFE